MSSGPSRSVGIDLLDDFEAYHSFIQSVAEPANLLWVPDHEEIGELDRDGAIVDIAPVLIPVVVVLVQDALVRVSLIRRQRDHLATFHPQQAVDEKAPPLLERQPDLAFPSEGLFDGLKQFVTHGVSPYSTGLVCCNPIRQFTTNYRFCQPC